MTDDPDSYSQAEIVRLLKGLSQNVSELRGEVSALGATFVTRAELNAWQTAYDREIRDLKDNAKPVKVSGWIIAGFALSAVIGVGSILSAAVTMITVIK